MNRKLLDIRISEDGKILYNITPKFIKKYGHYSKEVFNIIKEEVENKVKGGKNERC